MASSVRTGLPGTMSLIERTLNGEDPLDENGTAESPVPDFFMASWYSQCGTCGDSPVVIPRPPGPDGCATPSLEWGARHGPRPRRTNPGPQPVLPLLHDDRAGHPV